MANDAIPWASGAELGNTESDGIATPLFLLDRKTSGRGEGEKGRRGEGEKGR
jgi:hypothetical protein